MKRQVLVIVFGAILLFIASAALAQSPAEEQSADNSLSAVPSGLRQRVEFWKLIFTKYGEHQMLVHHREHPEIIYSALDFSDYAKDYTGRALAQLKDKATTQETKRIQAVLSRLAQGNEPRDAFELRVQRMFADLDMAQPRHYREAAEIELIRTQTGIKERFLEALRRAPRYLYAMEHIFDEENLPLELARLPFVESSFDYTAYSSVGAAGIWQFMRKTGKTYMRIDSYVDERKDPIISTRAAAKYLAHAYKRIGSWPLAITSYNHGITGVLRAAKGAGTSDITYIVKNYRSDTFGFASSNFYVEFLAALEVSRQPRHFFPELVQEEPWLFDEIKLGRSVSFAEVVRLVGGDTENVKRLNPALLSPVVSGRAQIPAGFFLKVPRGLGPQVVRGLPSSEVLALTEAKHHFDASVRAAKDRTKSTTHEVERGDTLLSIARRYGTSVHVIQQANGFKSATKLRVGSNLIIPARMPSVGGGSAGGTVITVKQADVVKKQSTQQFEPVLEKSEALGNQETYKIQPGDSLGSIARKFGVSSKDLIDLNGIKDPKRLRPGKELLIPPKSGKKSVSSAPSDQAVSGEAYVVKEGDTLSAIAHAHSLSINKLKELNPGATSKLKIGQKLRVK